MKRPIAELFDYKVLRIIESGMVVLNKKEQRMFFMKVRKREINLIESK